MYNLRAQFYTSKADATTNFQRRKGAKPFLDTGANFVRYTDDGMVIQMTQGQLANTIDVTDDCIIEGSSYTVKWVNRMASRPQFTVGLKHA